MFTGCFIHSFWTCGNQNQQCNYTFCCLHGAGSGQMLWWWQQPSWNISTSWHCWTVISHLLVTFPFTKHLSQHHFHLLLKSKGKLMWMIFLPWAASLNHCIKTVQVFCFRGSSSSDSSWSLSTLLLIFAHLTDYPHAASSISSCLTITPFLIKTSSRNRWFALLYLDSFCCRCDWEEPTDFYRLLGRSSGSIINSHVVYPSYIFTAPL